MKQQHPPITGRIVVTHQGPLGIVAQVNGEPAHFRDREDLFRAAVLLAESSVEVEEAHPPPAKGV